MRTRIFVSFSPASRMGKQFPIGTRMSGWLAIWREKKQKTRSCVGRKPMNKTTVVAFLATWALASVDLAQAQQAKVYHIGIILEGGPFYAAIDGLKDGLKELGFDEGKHFVLEMRDVQGDLKAVEEAARRLEREKVNLICALATSVTTAVKRATAEVPIVFAVGSDPVVSGLVESFAKPGGRLTGVHFLAADLTGKRLEILKEIFPKLRRVVVFYNPGNRLALAAAKSAREAAGPLKVEIVERKVTSVEELRQGLMALNAQEADAYFYISDAMVTSQAQFIIDTARAKKLPTMFHEHSLVAQGALVSYGVSYYEVGRLSAKYVQRILAGAKPQNLPVESFSRVGLDVNLKTAREIGVAIPQAVRLRADTVIQ